MSTPAFFPEDEYQARLQKLRQAMARRNLDACLISAPENIYYLIGLDHQGFFAYHLLIVPRQGELVLITRAMERVTVENQVRWARFVGYADGADPVAITCSTLEQMKLASARLGLEKDSLFMPPRIAEDIVAWLPAAHWFDVSNMVDEIRRIKSDRELVYMQQAATVSDAMMQAAIDTARAGVSEQQVAAEVHRAMILAGGEYPGFGPFIRSTPRLGEEHTTWNNRVLQRGDALFIELAGCVRRYHAPMGRLIFIGEAPQGTQEIEALCLTAFNSTVEAIKPGVQARDVYAAWQRCVDEAGLAHYRRHHCGYLVGIGFPPSWVGGSMVVGLRHDSDLELEVGMTFHLLSWLMGTGHPGNYFISNTVALTQNGCRVLTIAPQQLREV